MTAQPIKPPSGPVLRAYEGNTLPVVSTARTSEDGDSPRHALRKTHKRHARPPLHFIALLRGAACICQQRLTRPWMQPAGTLEAPSYYASAQLKATLERLGDVDRMNAGPMRFSVGAVNVGTGNFVYFDNTTHTIGPEHVM